MGVQVWEESFDSVEENDRCVEIYLESFDKEKLVMFLNYFIFSFVRFMVQVFFVQNEVSFNLLGYYFLFLQMLSIVLYIVFICMLNFVYKLERGSVDMKFFLLFVYLFLFLEERNKGFGLRSSMKVDKSFGSVMMDVLFVFVFYQFVQVFFGFLESSFMLFMVFFGFWVKVVYVFILDRVLKIVQ